MSTFATKNRYFSPKLSIAVDTTVGCAISLGSLPKTSLIHISNYGTYMKRDKRKKKKKLSSRGVCFEQKLLLSSIPTFWMRSVFSSISHINFSYRRYILA